MKMIEEPAEDIIYRGLAKSYAAGVCRELMKRSGQYCLICQNISKKCGKRSSVWRPLFFPKKENYMLSVESAARTQGFSVAQVWALIINSELVPHIKHGKICVNPEELHLWTDTHKALAKSMRRPVTKNNALIRHLGISTEYEYGQNNGMIIVTNARIDKPKDQLDIHSLR